MSTMHHFPKKQRVFEIECYFCDSESVKLMQQEFCEHFVYRFEDVLRNVESF